MLESNDNKITAKVGRPRKHKETKKFKDYYKNPEFKEKHLNYVKQKMKCDICNKYVSRGNLHKHKLTKKCNLTNELNKSRELLKIDMDNILKIKNKMENNRDFYIKVLELFENSNVP